MSLISNIMHKATYKYHYDAHKATYKYHYDGGQGGI
jgi:hypothetical protein